MNLSILKYLNGFVGWSPYLDQAISWSAQYLGWALAAVPIVYLIVKKFRHRAILNVTAISFSGFVAWALASTIKYNLYSPRPALVVKDLKTLFAAGMVDSFPSAHATFFAALAVMMFLRARKWGAVMILAALLIGVARVMAGVHFPVDVIAGLIMGAAVSLLLNALFRARV